MKYTLEWFGHHGLRWKREHDTVASAREEAIRVFRLIALDGKNGGAYTGLIYEGDKQVLSVSHHAR